MNNNTFPADKMSFWQKRQAAAILAAFFVGVSPTLAQPLPDLGESAREHLSKQDAQQIAADMMRQIEEANWLHDDLSLIDYVDSIGQRLVAANPQAGQRFNFFVLKDRSINAFAMPAGFIGVHSGLIFAAEHESELAAVLAHEMAHVTQEHLARGQERHRLDRLLALGGTIAAIAAASGGQSLDVVAATAQVGSGLALQNQLSHSRDFEREADRVGLEFLSRAGFDPQGMPDFFERLYQRSRFTDQQAYAFLRTHPVTSERLADSQNRVQQLPTKMHVDSREFLFLREKLRSEQTSATEARHYFLEALKHRRFKSEAAIYFGLAWAEWQRGDLTAARAALTKLTSLTPPHAMISALDVRLLQREKKYAAALQKIAQAPKKSRELQALELSILEEKGDIQGAQRVLDAALRARAHDAQLWRWQARLAAERNALLYHFALGRAFELAGQDRRAFEQYRLAEQTRDEDFYLRSMLDERLQRLRRDFPDWFKAGR